jgi:hypothetical protein
MEVKKTALTMYASWFLRILRVPLGKRRKLNLQVYTTMKCSVLKIELYRSIQPLACFPPMVVSGKKRCTYVLAIGSALPEMGSVRPGCSALHLLLLDEEDL